MTNKDVQIGDLVLYGNTGLVFLGMVLKIAERKWHVRDDSISVEILWFKTYDGTSRKTRHYLSVANEFRKNFLDLGERLTS
jgi:hypothetical protein